jgi:hypothetical protein
MSLAQAVQSLGTLRPLVDVAGVHLASSPFRYATLNDCIDAAAAAALLDWLEQGAPWRLATTDFYSQYEFSLFDVEAGPARALVSPDHLARLRQDMAQLFGRRFEARMTAVAHRLTAGQQIGIHNDYLTGEETHRLVVQLNRGLTDDQGGFLMLFNGGDARDVHSILRPRHRSGIAFEISAGSYHAVSRMHGGERYTLVFSFYAEPA